MKKFILLLTIGLGSLLLSACAPAPTKPKLTPLQIESMQTMHYPVKKRVAFDAVMTVFQDLGYNIHSADFNTGFISAKSLVHTSSDNGLVDSLFNAVLSSGNNNDDDNFHVNTTRSVSVSAFVRSDRAKHSTVRLNYVKKTLTNSSDGTHSEQDKRLLEPKLYQHVFNRINQAIFVATGDKMPAPTVPKPVKHPAKHKEHKHNSPETQS